MGTAGLFWNFDVYLQLHEQEIMDGMVTAANIVDMATLDIPPGLHLTEQAHTSVLKQVSDKRSSKKRGAPLIVNSSFPVENPEARHTKKESDASTIPPKNKVIDAADAEWELAKRRASSTGIKLSRLAPSVGERWYGGVVQRGVDMPFGAGPWRLDLANTLYNQVNPVMLSTHGRYIWAESPYTTIYSQGVNGSMPVVVESRGEVVIFDGALHGGNRTLRSAFLRASKLHFPPTKRVPDQLLFSAPQYNLWIHCLYEPTQDKVLEYASQAVASGFPPGVIMIDTNWAEYYGSLTFHSARFPRPAQMIDELHSMGFKVMVWVVPFVSPDSSIFREARKRGYLLRNINNLTAISEWWDGYSALVDFSSPAATEWFHQGLAALQSLGVDGFKFDGGDPEYYRYHGEATGAGKLNAHEHCEAFGRVGLQYNLSEFRAGWKLAGTHLVQRLSDKSHFWDRRGLGSILPNGLLQSLSGYAFNCPDMIGGGQYTDWVEEGTLRPKLGVLDEELFVRYAQASALFPMMQFSLAPWKVLDPEALRLCLAAAQLHVRLAPTIFVLAQEASLTGEPIVRNMAYVFPGAGLDDVADQFMLGDTILVAPVLEKGVLSRIVQIPTGRWKGQDGAADWESIEVGGMSSEDTSVIEGPATIAVGARPYGKLCDLPWFTLVEETHE
eukprot:CAMPEP_0114248078 /NCGR_PEP_ID=MMETSP0058-20121206/13371_1 /TAXON_ID=36894 /ORGANISM="Pyramimonas parkeae, CCMP726" /LENGTH=668 /DNA_ID=CAMNT_0001361441 /DNA_START=478 /DNA_END=2484 /DNA_ORIENTATION=+